MEAKHKSNSKSFALSWQKSIDNKSMAFFSYFFFFTENGANISLRDTLHEMSSPVQFSCQIFNVVGQQSHIGATSSPISGKQSKEIIF